MKNRSYTRLYAFIEGLLNYTTIQVLMHIFRVSSSLLTENSFSPCNLFMQIDIIYANDYTSPKKILEKTFNLNVRNFLSI